MLFKLRILIAILHKLQLIYKINITAIFITGFRGKEAEYKITLTSDESAER
jgi:hypothetical protein